MICCLCDEYPSVALIVVLYMYVVGVLGSLHVLVSRCWS